MQEITENQYQECLRLTQKYAPLVLPVHWKLTPLPRNHPLYGQQVYSDITGLLVIFTADNLQGDGKTWLHVSMSRAERIPSYSDMKDVKAVFIGPERQAIQIFPPESKHINIHPFCLHLWSCIEGDGLPDFGKEGSI